jgi:hypothetical protein
MNSNIRPGPSQAQCSSFVHKYFQNFTMCNLIGQKTEHAVYCGKMTFVGLLPRFQGAAVRGSKKARSERDFRTNTPRRLSKGNTGCHTSGSCVRAARN